MMLSGRYILPLASIAPLTIGSNYIGILLMMIASSLAALGFAIAVGTIARTHQQAAAFGVVSVVVFTALGGLWVPVYFMPEIMRTIATLVATELGTCRVYRPFPQAGHNNGYSPFLTEAPCIFCRDDLNSFILPEDYFSFKQLIWPSQTARKSQ